MEITLAERGQIVIPKEMRDKMGLSSGSKLEINFVRERLVIRKVVKLVALRKWVTDAPNEKLATNDVMEELRGRPYPWTGSAEDKRIFKLPHDEAVAVLKKRRKK